MIIRLTTEQYQELFALFSSCSKEEIEQVYDSNSHLSFRNEHLLDQYELCEEKIEFAIDAWRSVLLFLARHGYALSKDGQSIDLKSTALIRPESV